MWFKCQSVSGLGSRGSGAPRAQVQVGSAGPLTPAAPTLCAHLLHCGPFPGVVRHAPLAQSLLESAVVGCTGGLTGDCMGGWTGDCMGGWMGNLIVRLHGWLHGQVDGWLIRTVSLFNEWAGAAQTGEGVAVGTGIGGGQQRAAGASGRSRFQGPGNARTRDGLLAHAPELYPT